MSRSFNSPQTHTTTTITSPYSFPNWSFLFPIPSLLVRTAPSGSLRSTFPSLSYLPSLWLSGLTSLSSHSTYSSTLQNPHTYDQEIQAKDQQQRQLSKEFVRQWLISEGFQGQEGATAPTFPDELIESITNRYVELYQSITGLPFVKNGYEDFEDKMEKTVLIELEKLAK
jgi:hypothetical protein